MDIKEAHEESAMLRGNICRMFLTDNALELEKMYKFAQKRLERIYDHHVKRINNA